MKLKINYLKNIALLAVLMSCFNIKASKYVQPPNISIKLKEARLVAIFSELEKTTNYEFSYGQYILNDQKRYTVQYENESLREILSHLSQKAGFVFEMGSNKVLIAEKGKAIEEQLFKVEGSVLDANGSPLPGATIVEKGTSNGTTTDFDGFFTLDVSGTKVILQISYLGFKTQNVSVDAGTTITVTMDQDSNALEEVVVVGYGKQKKSDITGAVASVDQKDLAEIPVTNPIQALKGKVAGLDVYNGGNEPGGDVAIRLRGERSIGANNSPLIVLDGIPIAGGLNEINPNDIASIEILKDASATAIYGSRASNGVILITTKRGVTGETRITYNGYYGLSSIIQKLDVMDGEEFAQLRREAYRTISEDGTVPPDSQLFDNIGLESLQQGRFTDWQDFTYGTGQRQSHQLSVNGGGERTQFALSFNFFEETGIVDKAKFQRGNLRINLDHKLNEKINLGVSSFMSRSQQNVVQNDLYDNVLRLSPLGTPYDDGGNVLFRPTNDESQRVNPLSDLANSVDDRFKTRVFASIFAQYRLNDNLSYRLNIGPDAETSKRGYFYGSMTTNNQGGSSTAGVSNNERISLTIENIMNYNGKIGDSHELGATLVQSYQNQITRSDFTNVGKLPFDSQSYNNLGSAGEVLGVGSNYQKWRLLSYTGRLNYQLLGRYLFTATARADGSSRFAEGKKWGFFPSAAVAWKITEEPFFKVPSSAISELKLRLSYGETGNTGIDPYQTFSTLSTSSYAFGDNGAPGFVPQSISNPNLKWETTEQFNVGLDFELWKQRVSGSINYYVSKTKDLLLPRSLPSSSGFSTVLENIGSTENKGLEVLVSFRDIIPSEDFHWQADITFSRNRNKITELFGDGLDDLGNLWFIGEPIDVFYDYRKIGIWQTDEADLAESYGFEPGQIKVEDINNDGVINADDRTILGNSAPDWIAGLTTRIRYKGIGLSVVLNTRQNNMIYSEWYDNNNRLAGRYNNIDVDYWTPENPTNDNPRPNVSQESVFLGSTLAYKDVSYVRVRNVALSYSLPESILGTLKMKDVTFNLTAENPFTFTKYKGMDPEFESNGERALYPSTKLYAIGLNLTF
ncbi:MAG: SusC/RagA family TonB-linked outer membrane protein [Muricauda sp.]|nr:MULTISPECIES: TonB-dependent receptor [unclassified Allomuricauda]MAU15163.1 SusC/RagA family TonB-linked outer membrane protein [Allomuricauda sp.]